MARTYLENELAYRGITMTEASAEEIQCFSDMLIKMGKEPDKVVPATECFVCSICGEHIENEWSHNAWPVNEGRCCILCNGKYVTPSRIYGIDKVMG